MIGSAVSEPPAFRDVLAVHHARVLAELRGALEQARVEIEHVARVRFAARRAAKHERDRAVRGGLLREIVVHAERRLPLVVHEVLGHRASRVRRDVLHRRGIRRGGDDDDRVVERARLSELLDGRRDRGLLLADRDVDAEYAGALLIDDRVDRDRRLADAAVADDELALSASDRDHRVDRLESRLERLLHRLANDDARRFRLDLARELRGDRSEAVDRIAERVDDAAEHLRADGHFEHAARAAHLVAFLELEPVAENDGADVVFFEIEREGGDFVAGLGGGDLEHLAGHRLEEPVNAGDTVLYLEQRTDIFDVELVEIRRFDLAEEDVLDFGGAQRGFGGHVGSGLWGHEKHRVELVKFITSCLFGQ